MKLVKTATLRITHKIKTDYIKSLAFVVDAEKCIIIMQNTVEVD